MTWLIGAALWLIVVLLGLILLKLDRFIEVVWAIWHDCKEKP